MSTVMNTCLWCGDRLAQAVQASAMSPVVVACRICGPYRVPAGISSLGIDIYDVPKEDRFLVSAWIRQKWRAGEHPPVITKEDADRIARESARPTPSEKASRLLLVLGDLQRLPGNFVQLADLSRADAVAETDEELRDYLGWLVQGNLLASATPGLKIQRAGWGEIQQLREQRTSSGNRAFLAMWFDDSMDDAFFNGMKPAAAEAGGYEAYRVKDDRRAERIDAKIIAEIRACRFVVADVTGTRSAVYYEAGFAEGLGKPVIWTCRQDSEKDMGQNFDTRQIRHIVWKGTADLREQLRETIRARIV